MSSWLKRGVVSLACGAAAVALALPAPAGAADEKAEKKETKSEEGPKLNVGGIDQAGGTIKGVVKFEGKQNPRKPIAMGGTDAAVCAAGHKEGPALEERYVFGDNNTLENVLVYVSKGLEGKQFKPQGKPEMDQVGCTYVPHVLATMVNQPVTFKNGDPTLHNVKLESKNNSTFNEPMSTKGMTTEKKFTKSEIGMPLKCDVHSWMNAYINVMPNPFYAITQRDGSFEIKGLPPGEYEVSTWHEFNKFEPDKKTYKVKVEADKTAEVPITYSVKKAS